MELDKKEIVLRIPTELIENTLGFVVDAGSSVTKVVYRSSDLYTYGKPNKEEEKPQLRLRSFEAGDEKKMLRFLKQNCDIIYGVDRPIKVWMTGARMILIRNKLERYMNIDVRFVSEFKALEVSMMNGEKLKFHFLKPSASLPQACRNALEMVVSEATMENKLQRPEERDEKFSTNLKLVRGPAFDLLNTDNLQKWLEVHMSPPSALTGPAVLVTLGSMVLISLMDDKGHLDHVDYMENGGKTILGLAKQLTDAVNFKVLVKMAEKGDASKVNVSMAEVRAMDPSAVDECYKTTVFSLGKLYDSSRRSLKKNDLAAGLIESMASNIGKVAFLTARVYHVDAVYVCGSIARYDVVKRAIEHRFMANSVIANIRGNPLVKIFFFENPGFVTALGLWHYNFEKAVEMRKTKDRISLLD